MKLKTFLDCACAEIQLIIGEDFSYPPVIIIPATEIDEALTVLSEKLLNQEVFMFSPISEKTIQVVIKTNEEDK
jgi:hypothetical protein